MAGCHSAIKPLEPAPNQPWPGQDGEPDGGCGDLLFEAVTDPTWAVGEDGRLSPCLALACTNRGPVDVVLYWAEAAPALRTLGGAVVTEWYAEQDGTTLWRPEQYLVRVPAGGRVEVPVSHFGGRWEDMRGWRGKHLRLGHSGRIVYGVSYWTRMPFQPGRHEVTFDLSAIRRVRIGRGAEPLGGSRYAKPAAFTLSTAKPEA